MGFWGMFQRINKQKTNNAGLKCALLASVLSIDTDSMQLQNAHCLPHVPVDPKQELYGEKIMGKSEDEIISLMKQNGNSEFETETEMEDKRLSFDVGMMDFFFGPNFLI